MGRKTPGAQATCEAENWAGDSDFIRGRLAGLRPPKHSASALLSPTLPQKIPAEEQLRRVEIQCGLKMNLNGLTIQS